jgi:hypothetical protein
LARRKKQAPKQAILTVAEAAVIMQMTTAGVYAAIRDQRLPARRNRKGRIEVKRKDAERFIREKIEWWERTERWKRGELTDDEWVQRMWDNDPD